MSKIFESNNIFVEIHESEIPWLKIFSTKPTKEFSQCDEQTRIHILQALDIIEREMLEFFSPAKINIASFGNYVPHVHFHIMARFENDSFFPEPMWGLKQRDGKYQLANFDDFIKNLVEKLCNSLI